MPKDIRKYSEEQMKKAIDAVKSGMSNRKAASLYGVPRTTLLFRMSSKFTKTRLGPQTILTTEEETLLVHWITECHKKGFPKRKEDIQATVKQFLDKTSRENPFTNNTPGNGWYRSFLSRNPSVTLRAPEAVTQASAAVSEKDLRGWFNQIEKYLTDEGVRDILNNPTRVFNGDESNFQLCPKNKKVLAPKGARNIYEVDKGLAKSSLTVMFTFSAMGLITPPMIVFPYVRVPQEVRNSIPENWGIGTSENGWMTKECFYEYIGNVLYPFLQRNETQFPIIFFVDGHSTHLTLKVAELCNELKIILIALYPNATRLLQPADVSAFKPMKNGWKKEVCIWHRNNPEKMLTKETFAPVLNRVLETSISSETVKNGFRACGLYPWDQNALDYSKCLGKSKSYDEPAQAPISSTNAHNKPDLNYQQFINIIGNDHCELFEKMNNESYMEHQEVSKECQILFTIFKHFNNLSFTPVTNQNVESHFNCEIESNFDIDNAEIVFEDEPYEVVNINETELHEVPIAKVAETTGFSTSIEEIFVYPKTPARKGVKSFKERKSFAITSKKYRDDENKKIADKLLQEIAKDDRKKQRLINKEKREAEKKEKVIKGVRKRKLNPKLRLKDSGKNREIAFPAVPRVSSSASTQHEKLSDITNSTHTINSKNVFGNELHDDDIETTDTQCSKFELGASQFKKFIPIAESHLVNLVPMKEHHVKTLFAEDSDDLIEHKEDNTIGSNQAVIGKMCYHCSYTITILEANVGIYCSSCTRAYHIRCLKKLNVDYLPLFLCKSCMPC